MANGADVQTVLGYMPQITSTHLDDYVVAFDPLTVLSATQRPKLIYTGNSWNEDMDGLGKPQGIVAFTTTMPKDSKSPRVILNMRPVALSAFELLGVCLYETQPASGQIILNGKEETHGTEFSLVLPKEMHSELIDRLDNRDGLNTLEALYVTLNTPIDFREATKALLTVKGPVCANSCSASLIGGLRLPDDTKLEITEYRRMLSSDVTARRIMGGNLAL